MSAPRRILDALTMDGADNWTDVILKMCIIAAAGATFVTGVVLLLAEAVQ